MESYSHQFPQKSLSLVGYSQDGVAVKIEGDDLAALVSVGVLVLMHSIPHQWLYFDTRIGGQLEGNRHNDPL